MVGQIAAQQVALIGRGRCPLDWSSKLALVSLTGCRLGEQEAVICGDHNIIAVQVVDDVPDERGKFVDGLSHGLERCHLRSWLVSPVASTMSWYT